MAERFLLPDPCGAGVGVVAVVAVVVKRRHKNRQQRLKKTYQMLNQW